MPVLCLPCSACLPISVQAVNNDTWAEYWGSGIRLGWFTLRSEVRQVPDYFAEILVSSAARCLHLL